MRGGDIEAIGELAGDALAAGCGFVEQMHEGIASRPFGVLGPVAWPVRIVHDGVVKAVYGGVRQSLRLVPRAAGALAAKGARDDTAALDTTPAGSVTLAALNGLRGDQLAERGSGLALRMQIRRAGSEVPLTREGLAAAFPDAAERVAVFVHGLFETDESWRHSPSTGDRDPKRGHGERMQDEFGFTPVYVRYNTGLRVSDNALQLSELLERLVSCWPVPVAELVLFGHSTGGRVVCTACEYGEQDERRWSENLRHVFCLGSSQLGADLETGFKALAWVLRRLPETRALASLLDARSGGIKDLRHGSCIEEAQCRHHASGNAEGREVLPFLSRTNYYFIAAKETEEPLGRLKADLLNLDLLNHPTVYEQIRTLIARKPKPPPLLPIGDEGAEA